MRNKIKVMILSVVAVSTLAGCAKKPARHVVQPQTSGVRYVTNGGTSYFVGGYGGQSELAVMLAAKRYGVTVEQLYAEQRAIRQFQQYELSQGRPVVSELAFWSGARQFNMLPSQYIQSVLRMRKQGVSRE